MMRFCFLILGIELSARQVLYHLSHTSIPFYFKTIFQIGSPFCLGPSLTANLPPVHLYTTWCTWRYSGVAQLVYWADLLQMWASVPSYKMRFDKCVHHITTTSKITIENVLTFQSFLCPSQTRPCLFPTLHSQTTSNRFLSLSITFIFSWVS
jgi:hypothetical protein